MQLSPISLTSLTFHLSLFNFFFVHSANFFCVSLLQLSRLARCATPMQYTRVGLSAFSCKLCLQLPLFCYCCNFLPMLLYFTTTLTFCIHFITSSNNNNNVHVQRYLFALALRQLLTHASPFSPSKHQQVTCVFVGALFTLFYG